MRKHYWGLVTLFSCKQLILCLGFSSPADRSHKRLVVAPFRQHATDSSPSDSSSAAAVVLDSPISAEVAGDTLSIDAAVIDLADADDDMEDVSLVDHPQDFENTAEDMALLLDDHTLQPLPHHLVPITTTTTNSSQNDIAIATVSSRRDWLKTIATGTFIAGGATVVSGLSYRAMLWHHPTPNTAGNQTTKKLAPLNLTQIAQETKLNISLECADRSCITLDATTFQKKQTLQLPVWIPPFLVPPPRVIKDIPNSEVLAAAIVAGSAMEMVRNAVLYPLQTLKTRIQTDVNTRSMQQQQQQGYSQKKYKPISIARRAKRLRLTAIRHVREGQLYAGLLPTLLVAVPSTGVYYGTRDIIKRMLLMGTTASATGGGSGVHLNEVALAVTAAFVADVVSLIVRAPADTLALRLQSATGQESLQVHHRQQQHKQQKQQQQKPPILLQDHSLSEMDDGDTLLLLQEQLDYYNTSDITQEQLELAELRVEKRVGNWFLESLERLPAIILTDLPYLLSRIALNTYLLQGHAVVNVGLYEGTALVSALLCAFCTTPFDVVRTRILVEHDDENDGSRKGLIETFQAVVKEGDGGIRNLFAGWLERTLYLGISSLWLPFALVGYMAIRDAILLQVFE